MPKGAKLEFAYGGGTHRRRGPDRVLRQAAAAPNGAWRSETRRGALGRESEEGSIEFGWGLGRSAGKVLRGGISGSHREGFGGGNETRRSGAESGRRPSTIRFK